MGNSFGSTGGGYPLYDPRTERASRRRLFRPDVAELKFANSFCITNGRLPARGFLLLRRKDYDALDQYSTSLVLEIDDQLSTATALTFSQLAIVTAKCVSTGLSSDPDAIYLVEITDRKGVVYSPWFQWPTTSQYNIRAPSYPQTSPGNPDGFYTATLNGANVFSWDALAQSLWEQMTPLGPYPGLPIAPADTPEGWSFVGVPVWESLYAVLDYLGCDVATDLTQANPYTIVYGGAADAAFAALEDTYARRLEEDLEYIDVGSGRVPGQVTVLFHRRNEQYGTEETIRRDSLQWQTTPAYSVTVNSPAPFSSSGGRHYLWSSFTVRYDVDGNPLAADTATAATVASDMVNQYFARVYSSTLGSMRRHYAGSVPFATGSQVDGVRWYQSYEDRPRQGWVTEITRGLRPAFPEVYGASP